MDKLYLSPSSVDRWSRCPGSAFLRCKNNLESETNVYADEGQIAHGIAAKTLFDELQRSDCAVIMPPAEETYSVDPRFDYNEMKANAKDYAGLVLFLIQLHEIHTVKIETKLEWERLLKNDRSFSHVRQSSYADCILIGEGVTIIIDYKYGKGRLVSAKENKQLISYLRLTGWQKTNILVIHQPRTGNGVSDWSLDEEDAFKWAQVIEQDIRFAVENQQYFEAGDHCTYCPALDVCEKLKNTAIATAKTDFTVKGTALPDPGMMAPENLAFVLHNAKAVEIFLKACQSRALKLACDGIDIPGFKVVQSYGNRQWVDEEEVKRKFKKFSLYEKRLKSPAVLEKETGKGVLDDYIEKPAKGPVIVPVEDKRPEYVPETSAIQDFSDLS